MSDKQPLMGGSAAPPPPYNPHQAPPYPTGGSDAMPQPPPAYPSGYPQSAPYGATTHTSNVTVVQARPVATRLVFEVKPPNYIALSIIVFLCFCWIFGLIGFIMGLQVDSAWASGNRDQARRLSAMARGWNIAGFIGGTVVYLIAVASAVSSAAAA